MNKGPKTHRIGRNAGSGRFAPVKVAQRHRKTYVVERVPNPGRGDTK